MNADVFRKLASLGLTTDQIAGVLEIFDAEAETRKAKARARVQKWRDKNKSETLRNVTEHIETSHDDSREGVARVEDNLQPKKISGQEEKKERAAPKALSDLAAFKAGLQGDATEEQIEAFAKHRKAKNGQNSAYSARLFRRDAEACGLSVSEAIDTAISRGWLTVKPEYLTNRRHQATAPPPRSADPPSRMDRVNSILDEIQGKPRNDAHSGSTIDGSYERADRGGAPTVVQFHAFSARS